MSTGTPTIYLRFLKKSRKQPRPGDVFVLQVKDDEYIFGRVIRDDVLRDDTSKRKHGLWLVYIYNATSRDKNKLPTLNKHDLLIPPQIINRLGWVDGYFETVAYLPLSENDVLSQHCFEDWSGRYRDEYDNLLRERVEPCGVYGVGNYLTIESKVCKALGLYLLTIPREPRHQV